ncbi:PRC-barrel domain-containing protein [Candidatus Woesearchaeota archaeon]|nr:PRC-barrel domain-containing protein [Candidatus Woesearchaeota archaeon]
MEEDKKTNSKKLMGKTVVSKAGKKFGEVADIEFEIRTGELISVVLKNPTGYAEGFELEKNKNNQLIIPFSAVIASGDYLVVSEEDIV